MIKLKTLLTEATAFEKMDDQEKRQSILIYWQFMKYALTGQGHRQIDATFNRYRRNLLAVAEQMVKQYGPQAGGRVYRGIMLFPEEVRSGKVQHDPDLNFVSFTEDKEIAVAFGDPQNGINSEVVRMYPKKQGYLITADYRPDALIFHWNWVWAARMEPWIEANIQHGTHYIEKQKEVIILPKPYYYAEPIAPGESKDLHVGT